AACSLAKLMNQNASLFTSVPLQLQLEKSISLLELIDCCSWRSEQQGTLIYLAGLLNDPFPLLERLADPVVDDLFMHRRTLAALCLSEVDIDHKNKGALLRDQLAAEILDYWFKSIQPIEEEYFQRAIVALARMNAIYKNRAFDSYLSDQLEDHAHITEESK